MHNVMVDILLDGGVGWCDSEIDPDGEAILHMAVVKKYYDSTTLAECWTGNR